MGGFGGVLCAEVWLGSEVRVRDALENVLCFVDMVVSQYDPLILLADVKCV